MKIKVFDINKIKDDTIKRHDSKQNINQKLIIFHYNSICDYSLDNCLKKSFFITSQQLNDLKEKGYSIALLLEPNDKREEVKNKLKESNLDGQISHVVYSNNNWQETLRRCYAHYSNLAETLVLATNSKELHSIGVKNGFYTYFINTDSLSSLHVNQLEAKLMLKNLTISDLQHQCLITQKAKEPQQIQNPQQQNSSDIKKEKPKESSVPHVTFNYSQKKKPAGGFSYTKDLNQH
ncbi:hypothetical protein L3V79_07480 [Thiotrichales bacterium 19S9-12]|nr:hypothetical protein [Thiotrichales bacterium 19S9-11]MCF6812193.1 hypothetical protein [Thiotrichales bacterium 19S9-12]